MAVRGGSWGCLAEEEYGGGCEEFDSYGVICINSAIWTGHCHIYPCTRAHIFARLVDGHGMTTNEQTGTSTQKVQNVLDISSIYTFPSLIYLQTHNMVDQASSGKKPLPDMMTSIRLDSNDKVEIVDQLLLP
jgi:hypothetical protein